MTFARPELLHGLWGVLVIPLLYLVQRTPRRALVPHLFLWERVQRRRGVVRASRLREFFAMLLQAALFATLVIASAEPLSRIVERRARDMAYLIDVSAPMAALEDDGRSRLAHARAAVLDEIARLEPSDRVRIATVGAGVAVLSGGTADRSVTAAALERLPAPAGRFNESAALDWLEDAAWRESGDRVVLVVGNSSGATDSDRWSKVHCDVKRIGKRIDNDGFVGCRVVSTSGTSTTFELEIWRGSRHDRQLVARHAGVEVFRAPLPHAESGTVIVESPLPVVDAAHFEVVLEGREDALSRDDLVHVAWTKRPGRRVLVVADAVDERLKQALAALDEDVDGAAARVAKPVDWRRAGEHDVVILQGVDEGTPLPAGRFLLIDSWAPNLPLRRGARVKDVEVTRQAAGDVALRGIDLRNLTVVEATSVTLEDGARAILEGTCGALISLGETGDTRFVHLAFDPSPAGSSLALLAAWPLLLRDALTWLMPTEARRFPPCIQAGGKFTATGGGTLHAATIERDGVSRGLEWVGPGATWLAPVDDGLWTIESDGRREQVGIGLLDRAISDLRPTFLARPRPAPLIDGAEEERRQSRLAAVLAVLLGLLALEWLLFALGWTR